MILNLKKIFLNYLNIILLKQKINIFDLFITKKQIAAIKTIRFLKNLKIFEIYFNFFNY